MIEETKTSWLEAEAEEVDTLSLVGLYIYHSRLPDSGDLLDGVCGRALHKSLRKTTPSATPSSS